jgi:hypothetical protein
VSGRFPYLVKGDTMRIGIGIGIDGFGWQQQSLVN